MVVEVFKNDPTTTGGSWSTLASGYTSGATSLSITSNTPYGTADPTATPATKFRVRIDNEIFIVTDNRTTTWTVTGAQAGSAAANHASGATVTEIVTKTSFEELQTWATGVFGDGSDGDVTVSSTTSLTRDMKYNTLTITGTGRLRTAGWRVFVKGALVVQASGSLDADGDAASGNVGAGFQAGNTTSVGRGAGGNNGGTGAGSAGQGTSGQNGQFAGTGGTGGTGASGSGGAGGTLAATTFGANLPAPRHPPEAITGVTNNGINVSSYAGYEGGTSGGSGGGDGSVASGGGGAGGGVLLVAARSIANSGNISANGGAGGSRASGNTGGGGGGGGGVAIVSCLSYSGTAPTANGGAGGAKTGTGTNGSAGGAGTVFQNVWAP